jgi:D-alanyl-D-alanine dipeptidase
MEAAYEFFERVLVVEVAECGEPLVAVAEAAIAAGVPLEVAPRERIYEVRSGLVASLLAVAESLASRGWTLVLEEGFRTREMQRSLAVDPDILARLVEKVRWEAGEFGIELLKRRLDVLIASNPKTAGHMAGAAVDVSVRDAQGRELDRGAPYLELSELTPMDSPFVAAAARRARDTITEAMAAHGWLAYPYEFWHYSAGDGLARVVEDSAAPAVYGPVDRGGDREVSPIADRFEVLNDRAAVAARVGL